MTQLKTTARRMTVKDATTRLRNFGIRLKVSDGEYRVAFRNDPNAEDSAYYTCDIIDAVQTGIRMAQERFA